jgi:hypothetical protein
MGAVDSLTLVRVYFERTDFTPRRRRPQTIELGRGRGSRSLPVVQVAHSGLGLDWTAVPPMYLVESGQDAGGQFHTYAVPYEWLEAVDPLRRIFDASSAALPTRPTRPNGNGPPR